MSNWTIISRPTDRKKQNHHIWQNRGIWWIVFSLYNKDTNKTYRHRQSLRTRDEQVARRRRDIVLAALVNKYGREER